MIEKRSGAGMRGSLPQPIRYTLAILLAPVIGGITTSILFSAINSALGRLLFNGAQPVSLVTLPMILLNGFYTGYLAGLIAGKRGRLVAALAPIVVLTLAVAISLKINRDLAGNGALADWTWIGLIPAIIGGHLAAPHQKVDRKLKGVEDVFK